MRKSLTQAFAKSKISVLTAYTKPVAVAVDSIADAILVGDSLGMVLYGFDTTLPVTMEMMITHGKAVVNCTHNCPVIVDMPFGSYQKSKEQAFKNAAKIMQRTNAQAIKLEGGTEMAETIEFLTSRAIPVMGHIGLQPQSVHIYGSYKAKGEAEAEYLINSAIALQKAGCFAIVLEAVEQKVADNVIAAVDVPIIGIGASNKCAGQVLVTEDLLGLTDISPKFVKKYANLKNNIDDAISKHVSEVKSGEFPTADNLY